MVELEIWDQCHFVMDGQGFPHDFFSHILWNPLSAPPSAPKLSLKLKMESENIYLKKCLLNLPWLSCRPKTNVILSWMKAHYYCPSVPQNSSVVICFKKKKACPLPFFSITFFMFPPFTMAAIGHRITMQMCCEQGGGNIGKVEEVLGWNKF